MFFTLIFFFFISIVAHNHGLPLEDADHDYSEFFSNRIVGGELAPDNMAPHMAGIAFGDTFISFICGGSLITTKHMMTAAHCLDSVVSWQGGFFQSVHGVLGTSRFKEPKIRVEFSDYAYHPKYDITVVKNDVGILELSKHVELSDRIQTISINFDWIGGGERCYVTGWGTTQLGGSTPEQLHLLHVNTISPEECTAKHEIAASNWPWGAPPMDNDVEICTFHSPGHGMCHGDSGSALVFEKTGHQIGVVSWGFPCAIGGPDFFVRISAMKEFVLSVIGKKQPKYD